MWETDFLNLCIGGATGFLLTQIIPRKDKGILPSLSEIVSLIIVVLLGLLAINANYFYREGDINTFLHASFIDILQAGSTMGLGAISVYLTRRHYEEKQKKEDIGEIIAPLYFEVEKITKALQLDDFTEADFLRGYDAKWKDMKNTALEIRARRNVDVRIPEFYNSLNSLRNKYTDLYVYFRPQIDELFEKEVAQMKIRKEGQFYFRYETGYETHNLVRPYRYLIFGLSPIDFMKKDKIFEMSNCEIKFWHIDGEKSLNYVDIESECKTFFAAVEEKVGGDPKIIALRRERKNLIELSTKIHNDLNKKI